MQKYINAEVLMEMLGITDEDCERCSWGNGGFIYCCRRGSDFADACDAICNAPAADVRENKHGVWIKIGDSAYQCSACNEISCCEGNYCPDCGAIMDEEI